MDTNHRRSKHKIRSTGRAKIMMFLPIIQYENSIAVWTDSVDNMCVCVLGVCARKKKSRNERRAPFCQTRVRITHEQKRTKRFRNRIQEEHIRYQRLT